MRYKLRFSHRGIDGRLYWESAMPIGAGESRHEVVHCSADWFWAGRVNPA